MLLLILVCFGCAQPQKPNASDLQDAYKELPVGESNKLPEGTVTLKAFINSDDSTSQVQVEKSSGNKELDELAMKEFSKWHFKSPRSGWILKKFEFQNK